MIISLVSSAAAVAAPTARPNVQWSLVSSTTVVAAPAVASPRKLNVNGEILQIPWFDFGTDH